MFTPNPTDENTEELPEYPTIININKACCDSEENIEKFTKNEVLAVIKNLKPKKAPGYDLITDRLLKELPDVGIVYLTHLFNATLRLNFYPPQWKMAKVVMILKPGKNSDDPKSCRSISLLPIVSKIMERLLSRLMPVVEERKLIPDHQFGFRHKQSTVNQIHRIIEKINNSF